MPITWKNVSAPDFRASNRLAVLGQQQIQNSITGLSDVLKGAGERKTQAQENVALQRLSSLSTVAEVDAAFPDIAKELGSSGDQEALLKAKDAHISNLFQRERLTYDQSQRASKEKVQELAIARDQFGVDTQKADRELLVNSANLDNKVKKLNYDAAVFSATPEGKKEASDAKIQEASLKAGITQANQTQKATLDAKAAKLKAANAARYFDGKEVDALNQDVSPGGNLLTGDDDGRESMNSAMLSASVLRYKKADILRAKKAAKNPFAIGWDVAEILPWLKKNAKPMPMSKK